MRLRSGAKAMHFHLLARDEHSLHVVVLVHKVVVVVMLPGSDLPSTYNHALWWTLEDMWEVVGFLPTKRRSVTPRLMDKEEVHVAHAELPRWSLWEAASSPPSSTSST
jgi:hypothetical protein